MVCTKSIIRRERASAHYWTFCEQSDFKHRQGSVLRILHLSSSDQHWQPIFCLTSQLRCPQWLTSQNKSKTIRRRSFFCRLCAHILLSRLTQSCKFSNTSNLFLCGSPLGIFLHLDQAQIMPRKGRERTMREHLRSSASVQSERSYLESRFSARRSCRTKSSWT